MKIEFKETTAAGNNVRTVMYFDGIRVAEIHCTPEEYDIFTDLLVEGARATDRIHEVRDNGK